MKSKHIDIFLTSVTHLTNRSYVIIKGYDPDNKSHAGAGLFIKSTIHYEVAVEACKNFLHADGVKLVCNSRSLNIYVIYFPSRNSLKFDDYESFLKSLLPCYIVAGDFNAKHPWWVSRLVNLI